MVFWEPTHGLALLHNLTTLLLNNCIAWTEAEGRLVAAYFKLCSILGWSGDVQVTATLGHAGARIHLGGDGGGVLPTQGS